MVGVKREAFKKKKSEYGTKTMKSRKSWINLHALLAWIALNGQTETRHTMTLNRLHGLAFAV